MSYKRGLAVVFGCAIAGLVAFAATYPRFYPQRAASPAAGAPLAASSPVTSLTVDLPSLPIDNNPLSWARLTPAQHEALAPFASEWDKFSDERKRKWIKIASRFAKMSPEAQKRLHDHMTEWAKMTPEQRRVARENYQVSKELPPQARQNAWKAYQELPEEQKEKLAAAERKRRPTVVSAPPSGTKSEIKGINRLVNQHEQPGSSVAALPRPSPASEPATVGAPQIPAPGSFTPATPVPVSPSEAPSVYQGS
ncbi:DUF3106 domain-containing protein [Trinickia violacea]|uniref:DUF3106 domain-containing protein n=1 Tax=Trinickia violacea TaxID=2571746 RepID=A0A4P8IPH3_9BURK|nr:DUF3106 domain-containing protein [Trinickia violacea]QCP48764.1 DUF3106 domain-containing protein [Trinickia violacea]